MSLGEYLGAGPATTKLLLHLNGNSTDSSGNNNNGTDTAITYSQANGRFGQGAGFNGSSSKIETPYFTGGNSWTVSVWGKIESTTDRIIIAKDIVTGLTNGRVFSLETPSSGSIQIYAWNSSGNTYTTTGTIPVDTYANIISVYDAVNNKLNLYVNGNLVGETATSGNAMATSTPIILGAQMLSASSYRKYCPCKLDEAIYENRAWIPQEVAKYFSMAKGRFGIV